MLESTRHRQGMQATAPDAVPTEMPNLSNGASKVSPTNTRVATTDLENEMASEDLMELEDEVPNGRKRNDQRPSPVNHQCIHFLCSDNPKLAPISIESFSQVRRHRRRIPPMCPSTESSAGDKHNYITHSG